jgi:predicted nucleotidyltransferase
MKTSSIQTILDRLNRGGVRYVIAGGLAVVAHGYARFTADMDLLLALDTSNVSDAINALKELQYQPRAPVPIESLLDERLRQSWIRDKNLTVFSLSSPAHPTTEIDIFLDAPVDFEAAYARAVEREIAPGISARFVGLADLIAMKERAGRPRDLDDIQHLRKLAKER